MQYEKFLNKRKTLLKAWPWAGSIAILTIIGFWGYLFFCQPLLVNPYHIISQFKKETLPDSTLAILAVIGSGAFLMCGIMMVTFIVFTFLWIANERRYHKIIEFLGNKNNEEKN